MKIRSKLFKIFVSVVLIAGFSGCVSSKKISVQKKDSYQLAKKVIGKNGGVISDSDNVKLTVPPSALKNNEEISINYLPFKNDEKNETNNALASVQFGPSGTVFNKESEVTIKLDKKPVTNSLSVYCYNKKTKEWDYVTDATLNGDYASFKIQHFSDYKVEEDINSKHLSEFKKLVDKAVKNNYPDSWIKDQFINYLLNKVHIMDYVKKFDSPYYYKAVDYSISGQYHCRGREGDPNDLVWYSGDLATKDINLKNRKMIIANQNESESEYIKKYNKEDAKQFITDVKVVVEYEMITPVIELSETDVKFDLDEVKNINVHCCYKDPDNYFKQNRYINLADYELKLPLQLKKFSVDTDKLITNSSGDANFNIKCNDSGFEKVKVMFYPGTNYPYVEKFVNCSCGDYKINGHITENLDFDFLPKPVPQCSPSKSVIGKFSLKLDYDYEAILNDREGNLTGTMKYSNMSAKLNTEGSVFTYYENGVQAEIEEIEAELTQAFEQGLMTEAQYKDFKNQLSQQSNGLFNILYVLFAKKEFKYNDVNCKVVGSYDKDSMTCNLKLANNDDIELVFIDGRFIGELDMTNFNRIMDEMESTLKELPSPFANFGLSLLGPAMNFDDNYYDDSNVCTTSIKMNEPLLEFILKDGKEKYTSNNFKDNLTDIKFVDKHDFSKTFPIYNRNKFKGSTNQTITVKKISQESSKK